jgi:hypothetical protein
MEGTQALPSAFPQRYNTENARTLDTTSGMIKNGNATVWRQPSNFKTGNVLNNGKHHDMTLSCCIILNKNKNN